MVGIRTLVPIELNQRIQVVCMYMRQRYGYDYSSTVSEILALGLSCFERSLDLPEKPEKEASYG